MLQSVLKIHKQERKYLNTLETTKNSDFLNLLKSTESIVVELIVPNYIFIDLNISYSNVTSSITARFEYDFFNLSPNYFGSEAVLISLIEERGDEIFYDELCRI